MTNSGSLFGFHLMHRRIISFMLIHPAEKKKIKSFLMFKNSQGDLSNKLHCSLPISPRLVN